MEKENKIDVLILEWVNMFNDASFSIDEIIKVSVPPGSISPDTRTSQGVCGIVIPLKGSAMYELEGIKYNLMSGKVLHAGYNMSLHKEVISDVDWEFILIHYRLESYSSLKYEHFCLDIDVQYRYLIVDIVDELERYALSNSPLDLLRSKSKFYELIAKIFELSIEQKVELSNHTISSMTNYIKDHIDTHFTIAELSNMCGLDELRFSYMFKKEMRLSVKQYIQKVRIDKAKKLLIESCLPIYEISYEVGLSDPLYFSRIFKKHTGVSPLEYRNKNLSI